MTMHSDNTARADVLSALTAAVAAPDPVWTRAMQTFEASRAREVEYDRVVWMPAYREHETGGLPVSAQVDAEMERLMEVRCDAEDALIATPAPSLSATIWKIQYARKRWEEHDDWPDDWWIGVMRDLSRLADYEVAASTEFNPARWLTDFEAVGGGFVSGNDSVQICIMLQGYSPQANHEAKRLLDLIDGDPVKQEAVKSLMQARSRAALVEGEGA